MACHSFALIHFEGGEFQETKQRSKKTFLEDGNKGQKQQG